MHHTSGSPVQVPSSSTHEPPTSVVGVRVLLAAMLHAAQAVQAEVRDLQHEATVDDTVGTFQVAVRPNFTGVYISHALRHVDRES